jgi:hypothetical protein
MNAVKIGSVFLFALSPKIGFFVNCRWIISAIVETMNAVNIGCVFLFAYNPKIGLHYLLLLDNIGNGGKICYRLTFCLITRSLSTVPTPYNC